jgi:long-chain fatty acid transport protein
LNVDLRKVVGRFQSKKMIIFFARNAQIILSAHCQFLNLGKFRNKGFNFKRGKADIPGKTRNREMMRKDPPMFLSRIKFPKLLVLSFLTIAWSALPARAQMGPFLTGAGPINRSMGGTAVAAPVDGIGSLFWNPATSSALPSSSLDFGVEMLWPQTTVASGLPANAFGPGIPPVNLSGSNRADNGIFPLPSVGLIYKPDDSMMTYGLGMFAVAGFGVNYPASEPFPKTNPILTPQFPNGVGFGNIFSELQVMQIVTTAAVQVTDKLSIGCGPTLSLATLRLDPLVIATPDSNGMYPPGTHTRMTWGGGFELGAFYNLGGGWMLGASYKSPQWFEDYHFESTDQNGLRRNITYNLELPMIASAGVGYAGFERLLLAADFRWVDFADADGFRQSGFSPTGAVLGVGFRSIFAMSLGAQYRVTDNISLRAGYSFNQDPVRDSLTIFSVAAPTNIEHTLYVGASYRVTDALSLSLAYVHAFENSASGPYVTPLTGPIPGSSVQYNTVVDTFLVGATVRFGCHAN